MKQIYILLFSIYSFCCFGQEWESVASLPDGFNTHHSFAFSIGDTGYIVAGDTQSGNTSSFYSYNPETDEWTKKDDFPGAPRGFAIGDVTGGKAYFGFGNSTSGGGRMDDLWEYDPETDEWKELATCDCSARTHPAMVAMNGEVYVGLGGSSQGNTNDWWVYSIEDDQWEQRTSFPGLPRHHPYQFKDGEYVYVGFGHGNTFISNQWYRYNTLNDTWLEVGRLPAEGRVAGTQMSYNGVGLVLSGDGDDHQQMETGEFWMYDPLFDEWSSLPPHPGISRWAPSSFLVNDEVYILNGERNGNYLTQNFKFNVSSINDPKLNVFASDDPVEYEFAEGQCDGQDIRTVSVGTRVAFTEDVTLSLEIDPSSTAIEGEDFVLAQNTAVLVAGENIIDFELIIFDDAVEGDDRKIKLNLVTDAEVGVGDFEFDLIDEDKEFGTESLTRLLTSGDGSENSIAPFALLYTNAQSQLLYRSDILRNAGVGAGIIEKIAFDVTSAAGQTYRDFTVSIGHTNLSELSGSISSNFSVEQVFRANYNAVNGQNEIQFETPFEYDGERNLILQICFDNSDYTVNDNTTATDVGYTSTVISQVDGVSGCPSGGLVTSSNVLPNLTIFKDGFYPIYVDVNRKFQSGINENESIYFEANDSILAIIDNVSGLDSDCFTSELVTSSATVNTTDDIEWIDRIYMLNNEDDDPSNYEVTLIMPTVEGIYFTSDELKGLYSNTEILPGQDPAWNTVDVISAVVNEEYVSIKFPYQGNGYYTVGGVGLSTSTNEESFDLVYDQVKVYDAMGRIISTSTKDVNITNLATGIYFKTYTKEGKVLKTIKVLK